MFVSRSLLQKHNCYSYLFLSCFCMFIHAFTLNRNKKGSRYRPIVLRTIAVFFLLHYNQIIYHDRSVCYFFSSKNKKRKTKERMKWMMLLLVISRLSIILYIDKIN